MFINRGLYDDLMAKIEEYMNLFENQNMEKNYFNILFANGDYRSINVSRNNIPHLLGINTTELKKALKKYNSLGSYDLLKKLIENSHKLYGDFEKENVLEKIFSSHFEEKVNAFMTNIKFRTDDLLYAVKYDGERTYLSEESSDICDYYFVRKKEGKFYLLGVTGNDYQLYNPVTSRVYDNIYELDAFMKRISRKQDITYPVYLTVQNRANDYKNTFYTLSEEKERKLKICHTAAEKFDATVSVSKDFEINLGKLNNIYNEQNVNKNVLKILSDSVLNGVPLDFEYIKNSFGDIELYDEVKDLISRCNDMICNNSNDSSNESYTKISNEKDDAIEELKRVKEELKTIKEERDKLNKQLYSEQQSSALNKKRLELLDAAFEESKRLR